MKDKFLIGELSKIFNISSDTLRYYDKIDLVKPEYDVHNDYRCYSIRDFFKLSRILFLKNLDISLSEIKKYMGNKNTNNLLNLLKKKEEEIDIKINKLVNLKKKIQTKLEFFENIEGELDQIIVKKIPRRIGEFIDVNHLKTDYEMKQTLKRNVDYLKISSWLIEGQIYTSLAKEDMDKGIFTQFRYFIEIVPIDSEFSKQLKVIPEGEYVCITFLGPYSDMVKHYQLLVRWIEENGYQIAGDSIEKNIVDYDFSDSENEYISEIQIPIVKTQH
ncbi:MerR family transcriptional regulator [Clostridium aminobutyricum]|uniref:MerR family transcriptional regulator n=1 Tax=Clostridium aminobutyricum TaxID=33953 RepID=A0A939D754_CLOAM|nr:GyrI-like domain-containing protein [Clostridium aminobutyricum]MBN7772472.1 MerR family transcriptional regulator [Clostridium aminobutyricum]